MPDGRLWRARTTLPAGYQFGDAAPRCGCTTVACKLHQHPKSVSGFPQWIIDSVNLGWRASHENAAEQLAARGVGVPGEPHGVKILNA